LKYLIKVLVASYFLFATSYSQSVNISSTGLTDIDFSVKLSGIPDSIKTVKTFITGEDYRSEYLLFNNKGSVDTVLSISEGGNFEISFQELKTEPSRIRIFPGLLSVIPPLLAIVLALIFRQVIISLMLGIYTGAVFIYDYNPFTGLLRLIDTYIVNSVADISRLQILVFTLLFGGVIGLISACGGTRGIANVISKFARNRKSTMISTWLSGIAIFFDDYANTLIVGNLMRPVTDKMKISREKLSFIVDATAAPVASIFIISSWIGFEVGLIQDGLHMIGSNASGYATFVATIPYRFYPIAMLFFVFIIAYSKRDFGSMYKAEKNALQNIHNVVNSDKSNSDESITKESKNDSTSARWYNGVIPILIIVFGTILGLVITGINSLKSQGISEYGIIEIIGNADSYLAILWSSFIACIVAGVMILSQKILSLNETIGAWIEGIKSMLTAVIILTLAWAIGSITVEMKTADYIISLIGDNVSPGLLPVIIFIVCGATSFATGTSWGTMAIMIPIVIPLSASVTELYGMESTQSTIILHGVISSVLAGCVWGDHCSPISDTTILSSMASGCNHIDHVRTQLPYAIVVGIVCMILGDILSSFWLSPYISLAIIFAVLIGIVFLFGKKL
jgi:Na+/H+ antiporter NhaC